MPRVALVVFCLAVPFMPAAVAQEGPEKKPVKADVTGRWKAKVDVGGQTGEPTFTLKQDGGKVTGKYEGLLGEHDVTGKVAGDKVAFEFATDQGKIVYTGAVEKDAMKGDVKYGDLSGTWTAKREADRAQVAKVGAPSTTVEKATLPYATKGGQTLHLDRIVGTSPKLAGKRPVIIFSYGGGWESGRRDDPGTGPFLEYLTTLGYAVVAIDYRLGIKEAKAKKELTPANGTEMYLRAIEWAVEDLFDATSYVVNHADEWNIDKDQVVIFGGSAGATNSLVAEYHVANGTELARAHLPAGFRYAGVISMAGAFWLRPGTPLEFKSKPAPILFFHGAKDQLVTYDEYQGAFSGYGPVSYCRKFPGPDFPKWFVDYPEGDHVVAGTPVIDNRYEFAAFLQKLVKDREQVSVRTVVDDKTPKTFGNLLKLRLNRPSTRADGATKK